MQTASSKSSVASVTAPAATDQAEQPFPIQALPPALRKLAKSVSAEFQVPVALPACCILSAVSAAIGSGLCIDTGNGRHLRGNIYIAAGVASGSGKTEVYRAILKPVFEQQRWLNLEASKAQPARELKLVELEADMRLVKKQLLLARENGGQTDPSREKLAGLMARKARLKQALSWRIVCDDATGAALEKLLSRNPLLSASDEAGDAILGNLLGRFGRHTDEGIFLRAFSGGYHAGVDRIGRESVRLDDPCLTVLWLMQPGKLETLFAQQKFREDGLLARILPCRIETKLQKRSRSPANERGQQHSQELRRDWDRLWQSLHEAYHLVYHRKSGVSHKLPLPSQADRLDEHYNRTVERRLGELADMASFPARWTEQAWRLLVVLHAATHGNRAHLEPVRSVTAAIQIADWFAEEQLRLLGQSRAALAAERARSVGNLLQQQMTKPSPRDWITARDVQMSRITPTAEEAKQILKSMEASGLLVSEACRPKRGGHTELRYRPRPS